MSRFNDDLTKLMFDADNDQPGSSVQKVRAPSKPGELAQAKARMHLFERRSKKHDASNRNMMRLVPPSAVAPPDVEEPDDLHEPGASPTGAQEACDFYEDMFDEYSREIDKIDNMRNIFHRETLSLDLMRDANMSNGDIKLANIRKTLNSLGYIRSQNQKEFHHAMLQACLPHIYGEEWESCSERVLAEFGQTKVRYEVLILAPRRHGKTVSIAMLMLALLLWCEGLRICIFSTGKRASAALMLEIMDRLKFVPGGSDRILKKNQENLFLSTQSVVRGTASQMEEAINNVTTSRLYCFPAGTASKYQHFVKALHKHKHTHTHST